MGCDHCGKEAKSDIQCELCCSQVYCSTECRAQAWTDHQEDCNVHDVAKGACIMHPYIYEDFLDEGELRGIDQEKLYGQKHLARTVNANRTVEYNVQLSPVESPLVPKDDSITVLKRDATQRSLGYGKDPMKDNSISPIGTNYILRVTESGYNSQTGYPVDGGNTFEVNGTLDDMIQKGSNLQVVQDLIKSRFRGKQFEKYIFWPGKAMKSKRFALNANASNLFIEVFTMTEPAYANYLGKQFELVDIIGYATFSGNYDSLDPVKGVEKFQKLLRRGVGKFFKQLKIKGLGSAAANKALVGKMPGTGTEVRLIHSTSGVGEVKYLKDIEFAVDESVLLAGGGWSYSDYLPSVDEILRNNASIETVQVSCDPDDIDHVTGMIMALESRIADLGEEIEEFEGPTEERKHLIAHHNALATTLDVIVKHGEALNKDPTTKASSAVNAAVHRAQEELHKHNQIGIRWWEAKDPQFKQSLKARVKKIEDPEVLVETLRDKLDELRTQAQQSRKGFKSKLLGKRGKVIGRIRAFKEVVLEQMTRFDDQQVRKDLKGLRRAAQALFDKVKKEGGK